MKIFKIFLIIAALGLVSQAHANSFHNPSVIIGSSFNLNSEFSKIASVIVVGDHEFFLRYGYYRFNLKRLKDDKAFKNEDLPLTCTATEKKQVTCNSKKSPKRRISK